MEAEKQENACWEELDSMQEDITDDVPPEVRETMKAYMIREEFRDAMSALKLPQFVLPASPSLFSEEEYSMSEREGL